MEESRLSWRPDDYAPRAAFDPFPAYPHDDVTARDQAQAITEAVPPLWDVTCYLASHEPAARTNGYSAYWTGRTHGDDGKPKPGPVHGYMVLGAKRIMPHPAMTRYLVAHEYGHNVEWMLNIARGADRIYDDTMVREYARIRRLSGDHHGTGGRWHDSPTEILACDFRILILQAETEFWPHPGIPRPETIPELRRWWTAQLDILAEAREDT
jgi:hypothetical protein